MPIILDNKPINDITRTVECADCSKPFVVRTALEKGACPSCGNALCAFCGCTIAHRCLNTEAAEDYPCTPREHATCNFCYNKITENNYYLGTDRKEKIEVFRPRRRALANV